MLILIKRLNQPCPCRKPHCISFVIRYPNQGSLHSMEIKQQKADAAAQTKNIRDRDDRQRLAIRIAHALRDAGLDCEVAAPSPTH